jgi:hypothetical protein
MGRLDNLSFALAYWLFLWGYWKPLLLIPDASSALERWLPPLGALKQGKEGHILMPLMLHPLLRRAVPPLTRGCGTPWSTVPPFFIHLAPWLIFADVGILVLFQGVVQGGLSSCYSGTLSRSRLSHSFSICCQALVITVCNEFSGNIMII